MVSEVCRCGGFEPIEASTGREAFDVLSRGEPPALILIDVAMKNGARELCQRRMSDPELQKIPVVVMSDGPFSEHETPGLSGVVAKPIGMVRVLKIITRHVRVH